MSIGSETNGGVRNVSVCDLSLDGTDNGLRIKSDASRGGLVQGIYYTDVCIRDSRHPLVFDAYYSSSTGTLIPDYRDISVNNVHVLGTGGIDTFRGWDAAHPIGITLNNVVFDNAPTSINAQQHATSCSGPRPVNIKPMGTGVTVTDQVTGTAAAPRLRQRLGDLLDFVIGLSTRRMQVRPRIRPRSEPFPGSSTTHSLDRPALYRHYLGFGGPAQ